MSVADLAELNATAHGIKRKRLVDQSPGDKDLRLTVSTAGDNVLAILWTPDGRTILGCNRGRALVTPPPPKLRGFNSRPISFELTLGGRVDFPSQLGRGRPK